MSRVLYLFGLVIAGIYVKMIGFERLVDLSSKVQVLLVLLMHRVAMPYHRVAMCAGWSSVRGQCVYRVAIPIHRVAIRGQKIF